MVHRINIFLLSILLVVSQVIMMNQALAAGLGGWTITNTFAQGASTVINATKNVVINGANVVKTSTAKITPTASQVGKVLGRGVAAYALSVAVEQLLGSVDWVLDPANNQIKYKELGDLIYSINANSPGWDPTKKFASHADLCRSYVSTYNSNVQGGTIEYVSSSNSACVVNLYDKNGNKILSNYSLPITTAQDAEENKISLDTVAAQVISNAESNDVKAQEATTAAAADAISEAETDNAKSRPITQQLESNAKTQTNEEAQAETKPKDPTAPEAGSDIALKFPVFCSWAPTVCEAAQTVISFPQTLTNWWDTGKTKAESWAKSISEAWTSTKEWMNEDETPEQTTEVEIDQTVPVVPDNQYFNWGAYCPFISGSQAISLEDTNASIDYDLTSWCDMATDIRPFVLAAGALMSFLIAAGVVMGRDD